MIMCYNTRKISKAYKRTCVCFSVSITLTRHTTKHDVVNINFSFNSEIRARIF